VNLSPNGNLSLSSGIGVGCSAIRRLLAFVGGTFLVLTLLVHRPSKGYAASSTPAPQSTNQIAEYFLDWAPRVTGIQSEQPAWISPLVTVNPCLLQQFRYDQLWQSQRHGVASDNFGDSKGIELIPSENIEVILGIPAWIAHTGALRPPIRTSTPPTNGWADETFLIKCRLLSGNAEHGNYIVTAFMGFSAPTGDNGNSSGHAIFTPTVAFGKGFGDLDLQSTLGSADAGRTRLPRGKIGEPICLLEKSEADHLSLRWFLCTEHTLETSNGLRSSSELPKSGSAATWKEKFEVRRIFLSYRELGEAYFPGGERNRKPRNHGAQDRSGRISWKTLPMRPGQNRPAGGDQLRPKAGNPVTSLQAQS
jgi:hypothetical protein